MCGQLVYVLFRIAISVRKTVRHQNKCAILKFRNVNLIVL